MNADSRQRAIYAAIAATLARRPRFAALLIYLGFTAMVFGRAAAPHFTTIYLGDGIDQAFFIWCLVWWPYAIVHHLNPFFTKLIFAPNGFNLTWSTSIPLLSMFAFPLTETIGPIATFNLLCVIFPALSAWTAFLLCHSLSERYWPSIIGGYIFGFSSYMLAHMFGGHLNLLAAFLIPLAPYLVIARLQGHLGRQSFTLGLLALATAQFLITTEVLASMTIFGALALAAAWAMGGRDLRRRVAELAAPILLACLGTAIIVSPYLYYLFAGFRSTSIYSPGVHSTDLLNLLVPTRTVALGTAIDPFRRVAAAFTSNLSEQGGYVGLPLLAISLWFTLERRRTFEARLLAVMLMITAVAAMGPRLHIAGQSYFKLPWSLLHRAPLLNQALPLRLTVYLFLVLAVIVTRWLAAPARDVRTRVVAGAIVFASLLPNPSPHMWAQPNMVAPAPAFFTAGAYRRYLAPGEIVTPLPYARGEADAAMMWQALSGMYFRLAGGYPALSPPSFLRWPIVRSANQLATIPDPAEQWKAFAANHDVTAAIEGDIHMPLDFPSIDPIVTALGTPAVAAGGIKLYRVSPAAMAPYRGLDWARMEALADAQRFGALLIAAQGYLASGADPAGLSPSSAAKIGLLPATWSTTPSRGSDYRLYIRTESDGLITIGLMGTQEGLRPLIDRYGAFARRIVFPFHLRPEQNPGFITNTHYYTLMMAFDREQLGHAAALALSEPPSLDFDSKSLSKSAEPRSDSSKPTIDTISSATMTSATTSATTSD